MTPEEIEQARKAIAAFEEGRHLPGLIIRYIRHLESEVERLSKSNLLPVVVAAPIRIGDDVS